MELPQNVDWLLDAHESIPQRGSRSLSSPAPMQKALQRLDDFTGRSKKKLSFVGQILLGAAKAMERWPSEEEKPPTNLSLAFCDLEEILIPHEVWTLGDRIHELNLSHNNLERLPAELGQLYRMRKLDLSSNKIVSLMPAVRKLSNLTSLNLGWNKLTEIPVEISELQSLRTLDLSHNEMKSIPSSISALPYLEMLDLSSNQFLIAPRCFLNLSPSSLLLYFWNNPLSDEMELSLGGDRGKPCKLVELQRYMRLCEKTETIRHVRIMFVGDTTAGKTTLVKRLLGDADYRAISEENRTIGVIVHALERKKVRYTLWDFAGQKAYYHYHRLFLSDQCVYVLVVNMCWLTSDEEYDRAIRRVQWWVGSIRRAIEHTRTSIRFILEGTHWDKVTSKDASMAKERLQELQTMVKQRAGACEMDYTSFGMFHSWWNSRFWKLMQKAAEGLEERIPLAFLGPYMVLNELSDEIVPLIKCIDDNVDERVAQTVLVDAKRPPVMTWAQFREEVLRRLSGRLLAATKTMTDQDWALCSQRLAQLGCLFSHSALDGDSSAALVVTVPAWLAQVIGELIEFALVDPPKLPIDASEERKSRRKDRMRRTERVRSAFSSDGVLSLEKFDDVWQQLGSQFNAELGDMAGEKKMFVLRVLESFRVCHRVRAKRAEDESNNEKIAVDEHTDDTADVFYLFPSMLSTDAPEPLHIKKDLTEWEMGKSGPRRVVHVDFDDESVNGEHIMLSMIWCQVRDLECNDSVLVCDRWKFGFTMRSQFREEHETDEFAIVRATLRESGRWRITMKCYGAWNRWWQETSLGYWVAKWIDEACLRVIGQRSDSMEGERGANLPTTDGAKGAGDVDGEDGTSSLAPTTTSKTSETSTSTIDMSSPTTATVSSAAVAYSISVDCWRCTEAPITEVELPRMRLQSIDVNAKVGKSKRCTRLRHEQLLVGDCLNVDANVLKSNGAEALAKALRSVHVMSNVVTLPPFGSDSRDTGGTVDTDVCVLIDVDERSEFNEVALLFARLCGRRNVDVQHVRRVENTHLFRRFARRRAHLLFEYGSEAARTDLLVHYTDSRGAQGTAMSGFSADRAMSFRAWFGKGFYFSPSAVYGGDDHKFADYAREVTEYWVGNALRIVQRRRCAWNARKQRMELVFEWQRPVRGGMVGKLAGFVRTAASAVTGAPKVTESEWSEIEKGCQLVLSECERKVLLGENVVFECGYDERIRVKRYIDALLCVVITGRQLRIEQRHGDLPNRGDFVCDQSRDAHESHPVQDGRGEVVVCVNGESDEERSAQVLPRYVVRFWPREEERVEKAL